MTTKIQVPLEKVAFAGEGTREAWSATRRRVRVRFGLWSGLCLGGFALGCVVTALENPVRHDGSLGGLIGALSLLIYLGVLYACLGALRRLRRAREALQAYAWQPVPEARRLSGTPEAMGVPVQFRWTPEAAGGGWSRSVVARDPLRWNRWDVAVENGAWLAVGDGPTGVLALPGGRGLMTLHVRSPGGGGASAGLSSSLGLGGKATAAPQLVDELVHDRESAAGVRKERPRRAKLGKQVR